MAPTVKLGPTGVWIHRHAFEAAEATFLSGGSKRILKTNSQVAPAVAAASSPTQPSNSNGGKKKKGKSHKKPTDGPVSPSPIQEISSCPSKSPTPDIRVSESAKDNTKDESGLNNKSAPSVDVKAVEKEKESSQSQSQPNQSQVQQQPAQQQSQANENQLQAAAKSKNSKRKKNKSQSESISEDAAAAVDAKQINNNSANKPQPEEPAVKSVVATQLQQVREQIDQALGKAASSTCASGGAELDALRTENKALKATIDQLVARLGQLEVRVTGLEKKQSSGTGTSAPAKSPAGKAQPAKAPVKADDDDDIDLFGSDDDEVADQARQQRLKEYSEKKAKKPGPIAKSSVVLDIKPWDDETNLVEMEKAVRTIEMDGLVWGASKLVPIAYGVKKLQIVCVIEDEKVSVDELQEKISEFEDFVQSVDVAAFNKI